MPAHFGDAAEFLADVRALDAAGAEMIGVEGEDPTVLGAIAAVTHRVKLRVSGEQSTDALGKISRGRVVPATSTAEKWVPVPMPSGRDAWAEMMREQAAAGVDGVIVPWDARLIDLLRNPEPEDRSDLLMSTG